MENLGTITHYIHKYDYLTLSSKCSLTLAEPDNSCMPI